MANMIAKTVLCAFIVAGIAAGVQAAQDSTADDNFFTSAVNSVFEKVNKVTSGEEGILIKDYNKPDTRPSEYSTDALGRKIQEPTIRTTGALPPTKEEKARAAAEAAQQASQSPVTTKEPAEE